MSWAPIRSWVTRPARAGATLLLILPGCAVPDIDLAAKKCQVDSDCSGGDQCSPAGACITPETPLAPCADIVRFNGKQVIDGDDSDFAGIRAHVIDHDTAVLIDIFEPDRFDHGVTMNGKVAWSEEGLHFFFHVVDDATGLRVPTGDNPIYDGDGIEIFVKGDDHLTGLYDGESHDPGALQIILTPPSKKMNEAEQAEMFVMGDDASNPVHDLGKYPGGNYAFKVTSTTYDLELELPWSMVQAKKGMAPPKAGDRIGLDFGVDYHDRITHDGNPYQLLLAVEPVQRDTSCRATAQDQLHASCDDQTWCRSKLAE